MNRLTNKTTPLKKIVFILFFVFVVPGVIYFSFFFNTHLKSWLESSLTTLYGAEVNTSKVKYNLLKSSLIIDDLQFIDKKDITKNLFEIEKVRIKFLWHNLLKGEFVFSKGEVSQIKINSKRKGSGKVFSKKPEILKNSTLKPFMEKLSYLKQKNQSNIISELFSLKGDSNRKLFEPPETGLESEKTIKVLESSLREKQKEWDKTFQNLPSTSEMKKIEEKMKTVKLDFSNAETFKKSLKKIESIYKEFKAKYKTLGAFQKAFTEDIKKYKEESVEINEKIKKDVEKALEKLNIPSLNLKNLNEILFGNFMADQLERLAEYKFLIDEQINGGALGIRGKRSLPSFWLKKIEFSSVPKKSKKQAGQILGYLKDLHNIQGLGLPTLFYFDGDFPENKVRGISANFKIDPVKGLKTGSLSVKSLPLKKRFLLRSKHIVFGFKKGDVQTKVNFEIKKDQFSFQSKNSFKNIQFFVQAHDKKIRKILEDFFKTIKTFDFNLKAQGNWDDFGLKIKSSLTPVFMKTIESEMSETLFPVKKDIQDKIENIITKNRENLEKQIKKTEKKWLSSVKKRQKNLKPLQDQIEKKKSRILEEKTKKINEQDIKNLIDKIKF